MTPSQHLPHRLAIVCAVFMAACTAEPAPGPRGLLVGIEIANGVATPTVLEEVAFDTDLRGRGETQGNLRVVSVDADGQELWSGYRPASRVVYAEEMDEQGALSGSTERSDAIWEEVVVPRPTTNVLHLQIELTWEDGAAPIVTAHDLMLRGGDTAGASAPLTDVGGSREALGEVCLFDASVCADNEWCKGATCALDVCAPTTNWPSTLTTLADTSGGYNVVIVPFGWSSTTAFVDHADAVVSAMFDQVDWFRENKDKFLFQALLADCHPMTTAHANSRKELLAWITDVRGNTPRHGNPPVLVVLSPPGGGDAVANINAWSLFGSSGRNVGMVSSSDLPYAGRVLAHELGHAIGGLADEYPYKANDITSEIHECDAIQTYQNSRAPNIGTADRVPWACAYHGQACDPNNPDGTVVGSNPAAGPCTNLYVPCLHSIMRDHARYQFDPIGRAAMTSVVTTGQLLSYPSCNCSTSCDGVAPCGYNECFGICRDACSNTGGECRLPGTSITPSLECISACPGASCVSPLGQEVCDGDPMLISDGACSGASHLRLATCNASAGAATGVERGSCIDECAGSMDPPDACRTPGGAPICPDATLCAPDPSCGTNGHRNFTCGASGLAQSDCFDNPYCMSGDYCVDSGHAYPVDATLCVAAGTSCSSQHGVSELRTCTASGTWSTACFPEADCQGSCPTSVWCFDPVTHAVACEGDTYCQTQPGPDVECPTSGMPNKIRTCTARDGGVGEGVWLRTSCAASCP